MEKNLGGQKFWQRGGRADFVKFYLAPPKNTCCPSNAPQIARPDAATAYERRGNISFIARETIS